MEVLVPALESEVVPAEVLEPEEQAASMVTARALAVARARSFFSLIVSFPFT